MDEAARLTAQRVPVLLVAASAGRPGAFGRRSGAGAGRRSRSCRVLGWKLAAAAAGEALVMLRGRGAG